MNAHRLVLAVVAAALLTGCTSTTSLEPPGVTVVDLEVREATLFETTVVVDLRIANPNGEPLVVSGGSFQLELNGRKLGTGMTSESFDVGAFSTYVAPVTFYLNNASALLRLREILDVDTVSYGVRGSLQIDGPRGRTRLPIERSGELDLRDPTANRSIGP